MNNQSQPVQPVSALPKLTLPRLTLVVALSKNRVIGVNGGMPWHLPADLKHFKTVTWGKPIIMGRKTYESIGRALPGRRNLVISRQFQPVQQDIEWHPSLAAAVSACVGYEEAMVIGGGVLYELALPLASSLWLTEVDCELDGDTYFPVIDESAWQECERHEYQADQSNPYKLCFRRLERIEQPAGINKTDHDANLSASCQVREDESS